MRGIKRLAGDDRAIEGLPIRLVIALVVGVASLSVMMGMISGIEGIGTAEVDARPNPEVISPGQQDVDVQVVGPDGDPVTNATVVVRGDTARLDGVETATTGENGVATVSVNPVLGANQEEGTLSVEVKPPAGSDYTDDRENTAVLVVEE